MIPFRHFPFFLLPLLETVYPAPTQSANHFAAGYCVFGEKCTAAFKVFFFCFLVESNRHLNVFYSHNLMSGKFIPLFANGLGCWLVFYSTGLQIFVAIDV